MFVFVPTVALSGLSYVAEILMKYLWSGVQLLVKSRLLHTYHKEPLNCRLREKESANSYVLLV